MNSQTNTDFCGFDNAMPTMNEQEWRIVKYGQEFPTLVSDDFFQERAMLISSATQFEFTDLFSKGSATFGIEETSSGMTVEIPENPWFINDKHNRIIVFIHQARLLQDLTRARCIYPELPKWDIMPQLSQAFQKIGRFVKFSENWDTYGAKRIDNECISRSIRILKELIKLRATTEVKIPAPFVAPLSSGGIQIEWEKGERYLEISITPDPLTVDFFATDKTKEGQLSLEGSLRPMSALKELLTWFVIGTAESLSHLNFQEVQEWVF